MGFNAYDIAKLMGHADISTSQRYVRNLPVGADEAVLLRNQRRHNTVTNDAAADLALVVGTRFTCGKYLIVMVGAWGFEPQTPTVSR